MEELLDQSPPHRGRFVALGVLVAVLAAALLVRATRGDGEPRAGVTPSPSVTSTRPVEYVVLAGRHRTDTRGASYTYEASIRSVWDDVLTLRAVLVVDAGGRVVQGAVASYRSGVLGTEGDLSLPPQRPTALARNDEAVLVLHGQPDCAAPGPDVAAFRLVFDVGGQTREQVLTPGADDGLAGLAARVCREP